jgi:hypothetical protein
MVAILSPLLAFPRKRGKEHRTASSVHGLVSDEIA